jgi:hypothetical protein
VRRTLRKHRTALIALAVYNFVFFFPVAFMGRAVSPNDVFYNYHPWATVRPAELVQTQNSLMNDPPTAYYTAMVMAKRDWGTFHWNPHIAAGIPGLGSSVGMLSPFILLPLLLVPLTWVYTAIIFLKLNVAFFFAYLWLREERLGKRGAAVGALIVAGAGAYAVRWLWQITNATALYPALLWFVRRSFNGKPNRVTLIALVALAIALSGFPPAIAYGAWITLIYALWLGIRNRSIRAWRGVGSLAAGAAIAFLIALPFVVPFAQFLLRSGYLELRATMGASAVFPASHWRSFLDPERLGNPALKNWLGDPALGMLNNYLEATVYVGLLTVPLVLLGVFRRRAGERWFWLVAALVILACMFGVAPISTAVASLPGFRYSSLGRLVLLLPLPLAYLAAAAIPRRRGVPYAVLATVIAALLAFDLGYFAGRFHPYLEPRHAAVPETPVTDFLRAEPEPFRVAPFFDYLWPNAAEMVGVEDVRSHFGSEARYRQMLQRIDPTSWGGASTVLTFNSLNFNFADPLTNLLGIRWYIEQTPIDILKWGIFSATEPGVRETGTLVLRPGAVFERTVRIDAEPFWAIELPANIGESEHPGGTLEVLLLKDEQVVWSRRFAIDDVNAMNKVYVPLRPYARLGESVTLRVRSHGLRGWLLEGENDADGETPLFYGRVTTPVIFDREFPDGRLFRNLAELPRFRAASKVRKLNHEEFLAARDVDFATEAVITDAPVMAPDLAPADARVTLTHYASHEQRITTESTAPFFLASSEKLTPELRITINGRNVRPIETDLLFAGVTVPAGKHEVVFSRRIGRGWWWAAILGAVLFLVAAVWDVRAGGGGGRTGGFGASGPQSLKDRVS